MFARSTFLVITSLLVSSSFPSLAQTISSSCVPLHVVGGKGTNVKKSVSLPSFIVYHNNWNTDFRVPPGTAFRNFTATIVSRDSGTYDVAVYLKYRNKTAQQLYKANFVQLNKNQQLKLSGSPRPNTQTYQVNIKIGGVTSLLYRYTASVVGCY